MPPFSSSDGNSVPVESDDAYEDYDSVVPGWRLPSTSEVDGDNHSFSDEESLERPTSILVVDPPGQYYSHRSISNPDPPGRRYSYNYSRRSETEVEDNANLQPAELTTTTSTAAAPAPRRSILRPERDWSAVVAAAATRPFYHWMRDDQPSDDGSNGHYGTEDDDGWSDGEARDDNDDENDRPANAQLMVTVLEWGDSDNDNEDDDDDDDCKPPPGHVFPQIEGEPWKYYDVDNDEDDEDENDDDENVIPSHYFIAMGGGWFIDGR